MQGPPPMERASKALHSWGSRLSRRSLPHSDEEAALAQLAAAVSPATLHALRGSSELPADAGQAGVHALLHRYLAAEKRNQRSAAQRLEQQAAWRRGFGVVALDEVPNQVAAGKVLLQPPAGSAHHPLIVVAVRKHLPQHGDELSELERFVVLVLDTAASYCWDAAGASGQQFAVLFDLRGICRKNLHLRAVSIIFSLIERRFPERLRAVYLLDAGPLFRSLWYLIEPFIDATTRQKVRFVSGEAGRATLVLEMGPDVVPTELGGAAADVAIEEAVRRLAAWQEQQRQLARQQSGTRLVGDAQVAAGEGKEATVAAAEPPPPPPQQQQQQQAADCLPASRAAPGLTTGAVVQTVAA